MQLVTLNPLGPATSFLLTLLHTLELVPIPAHCGLPSKKPVYVSLELAPPPQGLEEEQPQSIIQSILQKVCSLILLVHHVLFNTPHPSHALMKIYKSALASQA